MSLPPTFPGATGLIITLLQVYMTATSFSTETNAETRAKYSKFSQVPASNNDDSKNTTTWPSKLGMMVIYTPALLTSLIFLAMGNTKHALNIPSPTLATVFCAIHFSKRCLEVMFLHKYSGRTDRATPSAIGVYYALVAVLIAYGSDQTINPSPEMTLVGTVVFAVGIMGNFYHHFLLAKLRTGHGSDGKSSKTKYVAPKGCLFYYVATPHYFFELIGWVGIAIVSNHLNVYLVLTTMASYLGGRSVAQNEFNRVKFDETDWPRDRKNLIPFVF